MRLAKFLSLFIFGALLMTSCLDSEPLQSEVEEEEVVNYLNAKGLPYTRDDYGFFYNIESVGSGDAIVDTSIVLFNYKSVNFYGTTVTDSIDLTKVVYNLPIALRISMARLKVGGEASIYIPSYMNNSQGALAVKLKAKERFKDQATADDTLIVRHLRTLHDTISTGVVKDSRGFYYKIKKEGTGSRPTADSLVNVQYTGMLLDSTIFDQTKGSNTYTNYLSRLINGWQLGVPLLKEGGEGTFYFPSALGYGATSTSKIPANSVLIFDIKLVDVKLN
ncbi:MAG: FKBP-type peptidyl-prolyl cis-trans isomerase [Breznakibacter sp.]|nr:FKBP-type peptidyl-prolyl cis-trans isomerase [Breznakibacter sp.]